MQNSSPFEADEKSALGERGFSSRTKLLIALESLLGLLGAWAYWPTLTSIVSTWNSDPQYSHGYLVVPIALAFCWARWQERPTGAGGLNGLGLILLAMAAAMRFAAARFYLPELDGWSIPFWLGGVVCLLRGVNFLCWLLPSLAFLWFATPLPASFEVLLSNPLQYQAARWGSAVLELCGHAATAEGTTIVMGDHVLDIERACSGLRMFYGIFALAFACVVFARVRGWAVGGVLLSAVPVALFANVLRIVATGLLLERVSSEAASKFSHDFAGLLMIPVAVGLFVLMLAWISKTNQKFSRHSAEGWSWLLKWTVAAVVLIVGLFAWSLRQTEASVDQLLGLAQKYEAEQQWDAARGYLWQYLQARPDDQAIAQRYAEISVQSATNRLEAARGVQLLMASWRKNKQDVELALLAAQSSLDWEDPEGALEICDQVDLSLSEAESAGRLKKLRVEAMLSCLELAEPPYEFTWEELSAALQVGFELDDGNVRYAAELAETWEARLTKPDQDERSQRALEVLETLIRDNPEDPLAWLCRYDFLRRHHSEADPEITSLAQSDLRRALEYADRTAPAARGEIYFQAALQAEEVGDFENAEQYYRQALSLLPQEARAYVAFAELKRSKSLSSDLNEAKQILNEGLERVGANTADLLLPLASLHVQSESWEDARRTLGRVEELQRTDEPLRDWLRHRLGAGLVRTQLLYHSGDPYAAICFLESLLAEQQLDALREELPRLFIDAHLMLASLYGEARVVDRVSENFGLALQLGEKDPLVWAEAISASLEAGDLESAEMRAHELLKQKPNSPAALIAQANIKLQRQLRLSPRDRNFGAVERVLDSAQELGVSDAQLLMSKVDLLQAKREHGQAEELLLKASEEMPDEPAILHALADVYDSQGRLEEALEVSGKYALLDGQSFAPLELQVRILEKLNRAEEARRLVDQFLKDQDAANWSKVSTQLAGLLIFLGDVVQGAEVLERVVEQQPANFAALDQLAQLSWVQSDWGSLEKYEELLRAAEGEAGTLWRFHRAQRLLDQSVSKLDESYLEVVRISQYLSDRRPRWPRTNLLLGELALRSGQDLAAIDHFERAWRLGDRSVLLLDRLLQLLADSGRTSEALSYIQQVRSSLELSSQLFEHALPLLIDAGEQEQALGLAMFWIQREPNNPKVHLRLGRLLMLQAEAIGEPEEPMQTQIAEAFRTALRLDPTDVDAWVANVLFNLPEEPTDTLLQQMLASLTEEIQLDEETTAFVLAQVNDELDRPLSAHIHFEEALAAAKDNSNMQQTVQWLERAAEFYVGRVPYVAESLAMQALDRNPAAGKARRLLIQVLLERGDAEALKRAEQQLRNTWDEHGESRTEDDLRQWARLLELRGDPQSLREAIRLSSSLFIPTADDKRRVAAMYEELGRLDPAFEVLRDLANSSSARTADVVALLEFWQRQFASASEGSEPAMFTALVNRVAQRLLSAPASQSDWLRWKLACLAIREEPSQIASSESRSLIAEMVGANQDFNEWPQLEQLAWCREVLQAFVEADLAECALDFVKQPPADLPSADVAISLGHAMILSKASEDFEQTATAFLDELFQANQQRADLARAIGDFHFMNSEYALAAEFYGRSLAVNPDDQFARNNLVLALTEVPERLAFARETLQVALPQAADDSMFLDTLAVLQLAEGEADAALRSLEQVLLSEPYNATARIHKAMAYYRLGEQQLALEEIVRALVIGVDQRLLAPRDRKYLQQVIEAQSSFAEAASRPNDAIDLGLRN